LSGVLESGIEWHSRQGPTPARNALRVGDSMKRKTTTLQIFTAGEDLPLFSGTPQRAIMAAYVPQESAPQNCFDGFQLEVGSRKFQIKKEVEE
jgi:hypothetical protein